MTIIFNKSEAFSPRAEDFNVDSLTSQNTIDDSSDLQPSTKVAILKTINFYNTYKLILQNLKNKIWAH